MNIAPFLRARPLGKVHVRTVTLAHGGGGKAMKDLIDDVFVEAFDNEHTVLIEPQLRALRVPALIVWGDDDVYFDVKWSEWLEKTLAGPTRRVVLNGARIFFPEERSEQFNKELHAFWS